MKSANRDEIIKFIFHFLNHFDSPKFSIDELHVQPESTDPDNYIQFINKLCICLRKLRESNQSKMNLKLDTIHHILVIETLSYFRALRLSRPPFLFDIFSPTSELLPELFDFFINDLKVDYRAKWISPFLDVNQNGNTLLIWLIANARNDSAKALLDCLKDKEDVTAFMNEFSNYYRNSAIHLIVGKGYRNRDYNGNKIQTTNLTLLEQILSYGADIDAQTRSDKYTPGLGGWTALHFACVRRDMAYIQFLLEHGANASLRNELGQTPLDMVKLESKKAESLLALQVGPNNFKEIYLADENIVEEIEQLFSNHAVNNSSLLVD
ncbi:ankyrin repeat domain-containing protein [Legionella waltersii]|uniref:Ankyrin repeat protein n=1 Tax=Legionella waltersii TaxID=66969 RepID=A0A0W1AAC9_9GAMM|nr:ankyrin repeat domain-containing protein [Legionella waltersii]KTD78314.1 Ankyrin repeat protein [Legionella waltersii]SNV08757.1 Ankyrin repeat [Legionella waltersii]